jgi:hypothetical protein
MIHGFQTTKRLLAGPPLLLALVATDAGAQAAGDAELQLRLGALLPLTSVETPQVNGTSRLAPAPLIGVTWERFVTPRLGVRVGTDAALTREDHSAEGRRCGTPSGSSLFQGEVGGLLRTALVRAGVGVGPRWFRLPDSDVQPIETPCSLATRHSRSSLRGAVVGSLGTDLRFGERRVIVEVKNVMSRLEGEVQHELGVVLSFPITHP